MPETWIVDVAGLTVKTWRASVDGAYTARGAVGADGQITPIEMPDAAPIDVAALFEGL